MPIENLKTEHFNQELNLYSRTNFKLNRAAALIEWRQFCGHSVLTAPPINQMLAIISQTALFIRLLLPKTLTVATETQPNWLRWAN